MNEHEILRERMKSNIQKEFDKVDKFWKEDYLKYTLEDKVEYWSGTLHRQMRWQVESGLDAYAIFSPMWYVEVKEKEPDIDRIIDKAFEKSLSWEWSKDEFLKRIGKS